MVLIKSKPIYLNTYIKNMENDFLSNLIFINLRLVKVDYKTKFVIKDFTPLHKRKVPSIFIKNIKKFENFENKMILFTKLIKDFPISEISPLNSEQLFYFYKSNFFKLYDNYLKNNKFLIITDKPNDIYAFYNNNINNFDVIFYNEMRNYLKKLNTQKFFNKFINNINLLQNVKYNNVFLSIRYFPDFLNDYFHQKYISNILQNINLILSKIKNNGNLILNIFINELELYKPLFKLLSVYFNGCDIIFNKLVDIPFSYYIIFKNFKIKNFNKYKIKLQKNINISYSWTDLLKSNKIYLYNKISNIPRKEIKNFKCFNKLNYNYNLLKNLINYIKLSFCSKDKFDFKNYEKYVLNYYKAAIINIINNLKKDNKNIPKKYLEFFNNYKNDFN